MDRKEVVCYCCGSQGYTKPNCKYKTLTCVNCKKAGHLKRVCKIKNVNFVEQGNDDLNLNS